MESFTGMSYLQTYCRYSIKDLEYDSEYNFSERCLNSSLIIFEVVERFSPVMARRAAT